MTPEDAKKKWCPMARVMHFAPSKIGAATMQNYTVNRPDNNTKCIGPECMAWRKGVPTHIQEPGTNRMVPNGYCGAFGKDGAP